MERLLPYILLVLLLAATWDESVKARFNRVVYGITAEPTAVQPLASELTNGAGTAAPAQVRAVASPKSTPFWQDPSYRTNFDKDKARATKTHP